MALVARVARPVAGGAGLALVGWWPVADGAVWLMAGAIALALVAAGLALGLAGGRWCGAGGRCQGWRGLQAK